MTTLSVLVVEDDTMIGTLLSEMLEEMGHVVCAIATTEEDAIAEAARHKPDLMIIDQHLRQGNGMSAMEKILRNGRIPCVFMSGAPLDVPSDMQLLRKPFLEMDLVRAIRLVIASSAVR